METLMLAYILAYTLAHGKGTEVKEGSTMGESTATSRDIPLTTEKP